MYAIIATGGKQYKVAEGDVLKVEKLDVEAGSTVTFDQVVAVSDGSLRLAKTLQTQLLPQLLSNRVVAGRLLYTSTREKPATTRKTVIDKHTLRLKSKRLMHNICIMR